MENDHLQIKDEGKETLSKEKPYIVLLLSVVMISVHIFRQSSRKHAYIILTPLNPTFIL